MSPEEQLPLPLGGDAAAPDAGEDGAWRLVLSRWTDDDAHRAYLARFADLEALALGGRRYREVLQARPDDPVAARWRDEVIKRATVMGLAALPRTLPPEARVPRWVRSLVIAVGIAGLVGLVLAFGARVLEGIRQVSGR